MKAYMIRYNYYRGDEDVTQYSSQVLVEANNADDAWEIAKDVIGKEYRAKGGSAFCFEKTCYEYDSIKAYMELSPHSNTRTIPVAA